MLEFSGSEKPSIKHDAAFKATCLDEIATKIKSKIHEQGTSRATKFYC